MKYVVTGGAGFVGRHLSDYLLKNNHDVVVIDNLYNSRIENISNIIDQIDFHRIDILDKERLKPIIKNADGIFHQAALVDVQDSYKQTKKFFDVNVLGTKNIFELSQEFGIKTVFASSSGVYGDAKDVPTLEISERMPLSPYAETKLEDEYLAEKFSKSDVSIIGLRYFNTYGKGQSDAYAGVITKFLKNALEKKQLQINGDGSKVRDFVYVEDVAHANLLAMESKIKSGFINIGTGKPITILELANIIIEKFGLNPKPYFSKPLDGEITVSLGSNELAKKLLNWTPKVVLEDWIESQI